ncbi:MAG: hypothetical protein GY903_25165 [Fuerstiella sp.]|nr:hypothetical protein [Fuerstiella sp.]MCP4857787.1 hypothetical protein [Fuerstiella sp.]
MATTLELAFHDVNGSGSINLGGDVLSVFDRNFSTLPAAPSAPIPPVSSSVSVDAEDLFAIDSLMENFTEEDFLMVESFVYGNEDIDIMESSDVKQNAEENELSDSSLVRVDTANTTEEGDDLLSASFVNGDEEE